MNKREQQKIVLEKIANGNRFWNSVRQDSKAIKNIISNKKQLTKKGE
jgi:hypothetical protein